MLAPAATETELSAVFQHHDVIAVEVWMHLSDSVEIYDDRAMDAYKGCRLQPFLEVVHLLAQQMRLAPDM